LSRITVEFFREPDPQLGYLVGGWLTMGMLLSVPMLAAGAWALVRARRTADPRP
jgi:phosphatidylglycerol:prolipoprotein diacylglycerol transferase